jgi:hypothetical protein
MKSKKWIPRIYETFYSVVMPEGSTPQVKAYCRIFSENGLYNSNVFKTEKSARAAAKKITKILKGG